MTKLFRSLATILATGLATGALAACSPGNGPAQEAQRPPLEGSTIGGPFTLTGEDGKTVQWSDFDGKYRIVYFGYTFCPDVCPLDVAATMQAYAKLEKDNPALAAQIQPIFITIDPERDTVERVAEFTDAFHPRLLGLTGTPAQIAEAAKEFSAVYQRGDDTAGGYLMDHSRVVYLMGRQGEPLAILPSDEGPQAVLAEIEKWAK
jgi:protein SCO1/2